MKKNIYRPQVYNQENDIKYLSSTAFPYKFAATNIEQLLTGFKQRYGLVELNDYGDRGAEGLANWTRNSYNQQFAHDPNFEYKNNSWGFRCDHSGQAVDVWAFGCSVTYGVGVPREYRWTDWLTKLTGLTCANYGITGLSTNEMARMFIQLARFQQPKHAVFLLPDYSRIMLSAVTNGQLDHFNAFGNYQYSHPMRLVPDRFQACETYYSLPLTNHVELFIMDLHAIATAAEARGIDVTFASWDSRANRFIHQQDFSHYGINCAKLAYVERDVLGRDQSHPGLYYHKTLAETIAPVIKDHQC